MINESGPKAKAINCIGREIFYCDYGESTAPVVLAVHGLGGQGRNFDVIATALQQGYRVICPDIIGRGRSQWAQDPATEYCFDFYQALLADLLEQLAIKDVHWLGTSMGGALGIYCAGGQWRDRIKSLVINDVGPEIDADVLASIAQAIGQNKKFETCRELAAYIQSYLGEWAGVPGDIDHWMNFAFHGARRCEDGRLMLHHDPRIATQFSVHASDYQNWDRYLTINCPTLVIRGALSTVLTEETLARMARCGPEAKHVTFDKCGHAPFLETDAQIQVIKQFLSNDCA